MEPSTNSPQERVRKLLAAMDRSIDQARSRRLERNTQPVQMPIASTPVPSPLDEPLPSGRPKARRMEPGRSRLETNGHAEQGDAAPRQAI